MPKEHAAAGLGLAALGVVYGDIGTSPLYALRECFHGPHAVAVTDGNVLGVLSLVIWSLVLVVSIKYVIVLLNADNKGEGGILALMTLVTDPRPRAFRLRTKSILLLLGLFAAALLYGDGVITPAISVLSAIEGIEVWTPGLASLTLPIALGVLAALFLAQSRGTARIGALFGPIALLWFCVIAALGVASIVETPSVFAAFNPVWAVRFFAEHGMRGVIVLGSVFLVATGAEAIYADLGHFGAAVIRKSWFAVALPALTLNYLGQGALLLRAPLAASILYIWTAAMAFEAGRRADAPAPVRFVARNSLIVFLGHMPVYLALGPVLAGWGLGYWERVAVLMLVCLGGLAFASEFIRRLMRPERLRAAAFDFLTAWRTPGGAPPLQLPLRTRQS